VSQTFVVAEFGDDQLSELTHVASGMASDLRMAFMEQSQGICVHERLRHIDDYG
jgi:hypothetical protein